MFFMRRAQQFSEALFDFPPENTSTDIFRLKVHFISGKHVVIKYLYKNAGFLHKKTHFCVPFKSREN